MLSALAFSGSIAGAVVLFGVRDLEVYEHAFFSLPRGTAVDAVHVLGHPVYTLAMGLGVRLPLQCNFGSSPAAAFAPFLPAPVTYWLMLTFAIGSALLVVRHALEPLCGRLVTWVAAVLLFWSVPIVTYTIYNDWPEVAFTYCALVACVFAPHALLALLASRASARRAGVGVLAVAGVVFGLIALSHPGYWPQIAATLVCAAGLALCRADRPWQDRRTALVLLATASLLAVAPQIPDLTRELNLPGADMAGLPRHNEPPEGGLIASNLFPFGEVGSRLPFSCLLLALFSLAIGLASRRAPSRTLSVGAAALSILLAAGATLPATTGPYSPSSLWTLRDSAAAFAVLAAAGAAAALRGGHVRVAMTPALAALLVLTLQGPAYAAQLALTNSGDTLSDLITPTFRDQGVWTRDVTPPGERARLRGLPPPGVPGERLALWPGVRGAMRGDRLASTDIADAGYSLVTPWTKQRTMRAVVRPNELLFNQVVDLAPEVLCDANAVAFLQLRYLLAPGGMTCAPWMRVADVLVDGRWELAAAAEADDRVRALPLAALSDGIRRQPALSAASMLLPALLPISGTALHVGPQDVVIELADASAARGHALVLPVVHDGAWRASNGTVQNVGGLVALVDVDQRRLTLEFVPDGVALLRATANTAAQIVAVLGFLGLLYARPRRNDPVG